jgi:dienelactone hydrolase
MFRAVAAFVVAVCSTVAIGGELFPHDAILFLDFREGISNSLKAGGSVRHARGTFSGAAEFRRADDFLELRLGGKLDGLEAMTVGGWFLTRRAGEQAIFSRGLPEIDENGVRRFAPQERWVNFLLGTDQRGFLMGTINGNGTMPFPYVTVHEVGIDAWHQLVVVKDRDGVHHFYHNGTRVHSSGESAIRGKRRPFVDKDSGEPMRLAMPHGGLIGEAWIYGRALDEDAIREDYLAKCERFKPTLPPRVVELREMNARAAAGLWRQPLTAADWPREKKRIESGVMELLGRLPDEKPRLDSKVHNEEDHGSYVRRKVSIQVEPGERMPAWLLVPKELKGRVPAVICMYGTTSGAGKDVTVGLSGRQPGSEPVRNLAFAIDIVEAGMVALAPDYLRDGERTPKSGRPYDTTEFYERHPDWSIVGKDVWDNRRAVDYLQTLEIVDPERIGMAGHSYGGHSTIFAAALEPRIKVVVANGPVSDFLHHGMHWAVPKGAGASQSLPNLRPYVLDHTRPLPVTFYEFTSLIAPRPLLVGQAAGEHRPMEEENYAAVREVYAALGASDRVRYHWYAGDHDFPPAARKAMVEWFRRWFAD